MENQASKTMPKNHSKTMVWESKIVPQTIPKSTKNWSKIDVENDVEKMVEKTIKK